MTAREMKKRFASEWILVGNPQTNESLEVIKGTVLHHSRDRDEVYKKAIELRPRCLAMLYTGRMPKDTAIIL